MRSDNGNDVQIDAVPDNQDLVSDLAEPRRRGDAEDLISRIKESADKLARDGSSRGRLPVPPAFDSIFCGSDSKVAG